MARFCAECGEALVEEAKFCSGCGQPADGSPKSETDAESKPGPKKKYATNKKCKFCGKKLQKLGAFKLLAAGAERFDGLMLYYPTCGSCGRDNRE